MKKLYALLITLGLFLPLTGSDTLRVGGLFYLDGEYVTVSIVDGMISHIDRFPQPEMGIVGEQAELPEIWIAPGLFDMQINGFGGVDFSAQDIDSLAIKKATRLLWKAGVTSFLPTVITADRENLANSFKLLKTACSDPEINASIPGFHLEGPYISPEKGFRGAHLEKYIRLPDWVEFQGLQETSGKRILMVTVAPEMEGAIPFIRSCAATGVLVSLGHHNGSSDQIRAAADAGATLSTHLGNGCANMINRHNNPIWPQLAEDRLSVTLIADGFHLNREELICFYRMKGVERTILVSDALDLAGLPPGLYTRQERQVLLTPNVVKFPAEDVLAGAASPVSSCVMNMMKFTGCSLSEAIKMASSNPARALGLEDRGSIAPGKRADLILFSLENGKMVIHQTIVAGKVVYE